MIDVLHDRDIEKMMDMRDDSIDLSQFQKEDLILKM